MVKLVVSLLLLVFSAMSQALPKEEINSNLNSNARALPGRIVGGQDVTSDSLKTGGRCATASMQWYGSPYCGATLISDDCAITACHCLDGYECDATGDFLAYGGTDVNNLAYKVPCSEFIKHPQYKASTMENDIGIFKVNTSTTTLLTGTNSDLVCSLPVCVKENCTYDESGTKCWAVGWGAIYEGGPQSQTLQTVDLTIVDHATCATCYSSYGITATEVCAGNGTNGGLDACQGDSGGPLIMTDKNGFDCLLGATSWGKGCAQKDYPGIWELVAEHRDWIRQYCKVSW